MTLGQEINADAHVAATCHDVAVHFLQECDNASAIYKQHEAAEYAASAIFGRLLLIHDDVDAAEAAFDYVE